MSLHRGKRICCCFLNYLCCILTLKLITESLTFKYATRFVGYKKRRFYVPLLILAYYSPWDHAFRFNMTGFLDIFFAGLDFCEPIFCSLRKILKLSMLDLIAWSVSTKSIKTKTRMDAIHYCFYSQ